MILLLTDFFKLWILENPKSSQIRIWYFILNFSDNLWSDVFYGLDIMMPPFPSFQSPAFLNRPQKFEKMSHVVWCYWVSTVLSKPVGDFFKFWGLLIISWLYISMSFYKSIYISTKQVPRLGVHKLLALSRCQTGYGLITTSSEH